MLTLLVIPVALILGACWLGWLLHVAPLAWEDEEGFHYGQQPDIRRPW